MTPEERTEVERVAREIECSLIQKDLIEMPNEGCGMPWLLVACLGGMKIMERVEATVGTRVWTWLTSTRAFRKANPRYPMIYTAPREVV